jgi:hypothetical protein
MQFPGNILSEEIDLRRFFGCLEDQSFFGAIEDYGNEFLPFTLLADMGIERS